MDALTEARDTNRRLNRRLGSMENHLHSMVSRAQRDTARAHSLLTDAQDSKAYWVKLYGRHVEEISSLKEAINHMALWMAGLVAWALAATAAAIWFFIH